MIDLHIVVVILEDAFWSALAAVGFAVLFNVPMRTLPGCLLCGAAGHALRTLMMELGMNIVPATLAGATAVGLLGNYLAQRWRVPATVFTIPGAIPMVPGTFAYRAMIGVLQVANALPFAGEPLLVDAGTNGIRVALILLAIAAGIAAPTLLFSHPKPVV